jgi:small-conductance mechanosensitive channel
VKRRLAYASLLLAVLCVVAAGAVRGFELRFLAEEFGGVALNTLFVRGLLAAAVGLGVSGAYTLVVRVRVDRTENKRRRHDLRNVLRFAFFAVGVAGVLAVLTRQYVGLLFSLGVVGFAVTFALQQPLFSLIG